MLPANLKAKLVIVSNNAVGPLREFSEKIHFETMVFDGSNSKKYVEQMLSSSMKGVNMFSVYQRGAFVLK